MRRIHHPEIKNNAKRKNRLKSKRRWKRAGLVMEALETRHLLALDGFDLVPFNEPGARIVNGTPTNGYPTVGIIGDSSWGGFCSGTLISPTHVLTAAHCAEGVGNTQGTFQLGGNTYSTSEVHVHPGWNGNQLGTDSADDIAIYTLSTPVSGVTPTEIFRGTPAVGQLLTLVGYGGGGTGSTGHSGDFGTLREGTTPIDYVSWTIIAWDFENSSESNTAPGDSGGPAFLDVGGTLYLAGVTSGGNNATAGYGDYSFDTRVDAYQDWIDSIVGTAGGGGGDTGGGGGDTGGGGSETGDRFEFANQTPIAIDSNDAGTILSQLEVTGLQGVVTDLNVQIDIDHTWNADLLITLISPDGTRLEMINGQGGSDDNFTMTWLDDEAAVSITEGVAPFQGTFRPQNPLAGYDGIDPNGVWGLEVADTYALDGGSLNAWKLSFDMSDAGGGESGGGGGETGGRFDFTNDTALPIDPNDAGTIQSQLAVAGLKGVVTDLNVQIDIDHTWNADLVITLISPDGTRLEMINGQGGSDDNFNLTWLDDEAAMSITEGSAPFEGTFRPLSPLASYDGIDPNGLWSLEVADTYALDGGSLNAWTLSFEMSDAGGGGESGGGGGETDNTLHFTNNDPIRIRSNSANTINSLTTVSGVSGNITDVNVTLDIEHTWDEDLVVWLISPSGTAVRLFRGVGGSADNFTGTILDDEASTPIRQGEAPFSGSFRPQVALSNLDGEDPNGIWRLRVRDRYAADGGWLNSWTLSLTTDSAGRHFHARHAGAEHHQSEFTVDLDFGDGHWTEQARTIIQDAASYWETLIHGDLPDVQTDTGIIDDVLIQVSMSELDGSGAALGEASPELLRPESLLPATGQLRFDRLDFEGLLRSGDLLNVAIHEIGHVLGVGTLWEVHDLIQHQDDGSIDYLGHEALHAYAETYGIHEVSAIPVETDGGAGSAGSHWDDEGDHCDIMVSTYHHGAEAYVSEVTIASLADLGYQINTHDDDLAIPLATYGAGESSIGEFAGEESPLDAPTRIAELLDWEVLVTKQNANTPLWLAGDSWQSSEGAERLREEAMDRVLVALEAEGSADGFEMDDESLDCIANRSWQGVTNLALELISEEAMESLPEELDLAIESLVGDPFQPLAV